MGIWADPANVELLKTSIQDGKKYSEIAEIFAGMGLRVSRNAIIGRAHRMNLCLPAPPKKLVHPSKRRRSPREAGKIAPVVPPPPAQFEISLFDLQRYHCRYPSQTGDRYCGDVRIAESPYCLHHHRICYISSKYRVVADAGTSC